MMRCCPKCHITSMPRDMPAFASTKLAQRATSSCLPCVPGTELGFQGWMCCGCPKGRAEQRVTLFPVHRLGCQSSQHCSSPKLFYRRKLPSFFLTFKKIIVVTQEEERGRVPSNDMGTEVCREWGGGKQPGCPGPMNLTSWTMTFCVLPTAEGFWRAKSSSLLCGDNSSSGVIKTGPDHKSEWIKPLGKERDKRYEKLYISKDAGQKSPEGMGVLGDIYFCLPRCHCCRGGLLTSVSMLTPTPGESNGSWLDGYQFAKKRIPWEFHCHFMGHHFWSEKELRQWLSPCLCHHHYQLFSPVPWRMWNFEITGP